MSLLSFLRRRKAPPDEGKQEQQREIAAQLAALRPFGSMIVCPKCGAAQITRVYYSGFLRHHFYGHMPALPYRVPPEHIEATCAACGFSQLERCRDADR